MKRHSEETAIVVEEWLEVESEVKQKRLKNEEKRSVIPTL